MLLLADCAFAKDVDGLDLAPIDDDEREPCSVLEFATDDGDDVGFVVGDVFNFFAPGNPSSFSEIEDGNSLFVVTLLLL